MPGAAFGDHGDRYASYRCARPFSAEYSRDRRFRCEHSLDDVAPHHSSAGSVGRGSRQRYGLSGQREFWLLASLPTVA